MNDQVEQRKGEPVPDDEALLARFLAGDDKAFSELFNRYREPLWRLVYYYTHDSEAASDIIGDVFMRVAKHAHTFRLDMIFSSWIYRIAVNCTRNFIAGRKKQDLIVDRETVRLKSSPAGFPSPEEEFISNFESEAMTSAVNNLKGRFKEVFVLRFEHQMPYREIGVVLSCSERTAKWRMKRAVEEITAYLSEKGIL